MLSNTYRTALITGAASGIGRTLAKHLAREGVAIAAIDRRGDGLESLAQELASTPGRCAWSIADVTQAAELQAKIAELESRLGPTDLLIGCAGIGIETSALAYSARDMQAVIDVNLTGVSNSIAAVLPGMLERRRGHIVGLSSLASYLGIPRMLGYCASKAGLNALLEGLRLETRRRGITVTTICPGWIHTPMTEPLVGRIPMLTLEAAVARMISAIRRRRAFVAFPASLIWQIRLMKWSPGFVQDWLLSRQERAYRQLFDARS